MKKLNVLLMIACCFSLSTKSMDKSMMAERRAKEAEQRRAKQQKALQLQEERRAGTKRTGEGVEAAGARKEVTFSVKSPVTRNTQGIVARNTQEITLQRHSDGYHLADAVQQLEKDKTGIDVQNMSNEDLKNIKILFRGYPLPAIISEDQMNAILLDETMQVILTKPETEMEKARREGDALGFGMDPTESSRLVNEYINKSSDIRTAFFGAYVNSSARVLGSHIPRVFQFGELLPEFKNNTNQLYLTIHDMIAMGIQLGIDESTYKKLITDAIIKGFYHLIPMSGRGAQGVFRTDLLKQVVERILAGERHW